jgi:hypothetical protein
VLRRLHRLLAGSDGPGRAALPAGEFLHPLPLLAVLVLALNDHFLKGARLLPAALTGKLSDVAGLLFFPLLLTAGLDTVAFGVARLGIPLDFSLRRWKLAAAVAATAAAFVAVKLSPIAAGAAARALSLVFSSRIVADPTDLLALPALLVPFLLGRAELRRVPLGRLEVLRRGDVRAGLADVVRCGGDPADVAALVESYATWLGGEGAAKERVEGALVRLRAR